ncbi:PulJ/GspJ family protein [Hyphomicrobium facile]|uniref:General secretion pathway protein J n=1 Tax=Hyphomicrobium facile TaxID=51670 RepID=A0A1I7N4L2_9HYPH|nr:prepilin-type N-terminal cleavage/methylation domain-containing protein [Hyphomicrobium facile]SFV29594.1 general secretion pathway protein J [Hyphomicrobium facile]
MNSFQPLPKSRTDVPLRRPDEAGFTLVELLVSITILSVVLALLGVGIRIFSTNWEANSKHIETLDMVSRSYDILNRDAAGLQRLINADGASPRYLFSGERDALSFVTVEPPYPSETGLYFVRYSAGSGDQGTELIRARAPYQPAMQTFPGATPANHVSLLEGPFAYRFSYAMANDGQKSWLISWPYQNRLPDLVRLEIIDVREQKPLAPPLVVAIRADAELACIEEKSPLCSAAKDGALGKASNSDHDEANPREKAEHE